MIHHTICYLTSVFSVLLFASTANASTKPQTEHCMAPLTMPIARIEYKPKLGGAVVKHRNKRDEARLQRYMKQCHAKTQRGQACKMFLAGTREVQTSSGPSLSLPGAAGDLPDTGSTELQATYVCTTSASIADNNCAEDHIAVVDPNRIENPVVACTFSPDGDCPSNTSPVFSSEGVVACALKAETPNPGPTATSTPTTTPNPGPTVTSTPTTVPRPRPTVSSTPTVTPTGIPGQKN